MLAQTLNGILKMSYTISQTRSFVEQENIAMHKFVAGIKFFCKFQFSIFISWIDVNDYKNSQIGYIVNLNVIRIP